MAIENISLDELKQGLGDGSLVVVDVREADEFASGHIPGAVSNPLSSFSTGALPAGKRIIIACRSGQRSKVALAMAQSSGRPDVTGHFPGGMLEWQASGQPIEK